MLNHDAWLEAPYQEETDYHEEKFYIPVVKLNDVEIWRDDDDEHNFSAAAIHTAQLWIEAHDGDFSEEEMPWPGFEVKWVAHGHDPDDYIDDDR
jgi:hypothetical protein